MDTFHGDSSFNIGHILNNWPFDPFSVNVRKLEENGREYLQMRVDMGVLQLDIEGRPDGKRPNGQRSYYDYLKSEVKVNSDFVLDEDQCIEIDREFVQYYHRRICWLQLKEFDRAVADADHTLGLMDLCKQFSGNEEWTVSHEQYRPFVMYHRTQAAALAVLENGEENSPEQAIAKVDAGLEEIRSLFAHYNAEDQFDDDELVKRLIDFRDGLRQRYEVGDSRDELEKKMKAAIEEEDYETAASIRDQIAALDSSTEFVMEESDSFDFDISDPENTDA